MAESAAKTIVNRQSGITTALAMKPKSGRAKASSDVRAPAIANENTQADENEPESEYRVRVGR